MIIINEFTKKIITKKLNEIQISGKASHCVLLNFSVTDINVNSIAPTIQQYIEFGVEGEDPFQLFICDDGDAYILWYGTAMTDIQFFLKYLGDTLSIDILDLSTIFELPSQVCDVLASITTDT